MHDSDMSDVEAGLPTARSQPASRMKHSDAEVDLYTYMRLLPRPEAAKAAPQEVSFCRDRFSPTGELGCSGIRGAVGLGYRFTVQGYPYCYSDILLLN
jgi:hypothetical protein